MQYNKKIKFMHWNAQGITSFSAVQQLQLLLDAEKIDILSLNETFLKPHHKLYLDNYKIYRNDRDSAHGGGVAIAIRNTIKHKALPFTTTSSIENISIITYINGRSTTFTAAYCPKYTNSFEADVKKITRSNEDFFVFGDFNAKNNAWNCSRNNTAGNILNELQARSHFFIHHPNAPTHYPHSGTTPSTIDILLSNSTLYISPLNAHCDQLMSDHTPVTCIIDAVTLDESPIKLPNYKLADWKKFREHINNKIDLNNDFTINDASPELINNAINKLCSTIIEAKTIAVPLAVKKNKFLQISKTTIACIKTRNAIKRKWQRCNEPNMKAAYKSSLNQINKLINENVNLDRNNNWNNMISNLETGDKKFWRISKGIRGKYSKNIGKLQLNNTELTTNEQKANAIADTFEKAHNLTVDLQHSIDTKVNRFNKQLIQDTEINEDARTYTTPNEIKSVITKLKTSKAPGFDGIQNILLKQLPERALILLTMLINGCFRIGYFPEPFKCAKILPIQKPGKDPKLTTSYRPISLLSCLGKLFERIIYSRLSEFSFNNNIIAKEQFGFRTQHSTVHQIRRITNIVNKNKMIRKSTGIVLLDIEKAFDSVWHNGLIFKLNKSNVPKYIVKLIKSFVSDRKFFVFINGTASTKRKIPAGLPQGSVLSPLLYSIFISDFKKPKCCDVGYYADDTCFLCSGKLTKAIIKRLQKSLQAIQKYLRKWKIKLNQEKTEAIIFPFNKSPKRQPQTNLKFLDTEIVFSKQCKYLGVILDQKLTFGPHITKAREKAINCMRAMFPLLGRKSKLSTKNKYLIYKMVIRPTFTYAAPVWGHAAKTHIKKLQIVQNKCLKMINKLPMDHSTAHLHETTGYKMIADLIQEQTFKFNARCRNSSFSLIREIVED